ncbi:MAG TPA: hypothetical protein VIR02_17610, partial [Anaerolineales bacterium]
NATQVWAINPSAWGFDTNLVGPNVFQPVLFAGQYQDTETVALLEDGSTVHRPGLVLNGFRTYDPFTGSYLQDLQVLQVDPLVPETWSSYGYCASDPVGKIDRDGMMSSETIIIVDTKPTIEGEPGWDWEALGLKSIESGTIHSSSSVGFGAQLVVARTFAPSGWNQGRLRFGIDRCTGPGSVWACKSCEDSCLSVWSADFQFCWTGGYLHECVDDVDNSYDDCMATCHRIGGPCDFRCF